jgi:hypothetical protein
MTKITIDWSQIKTTQTGKEYKAVTFKDASGAEVTASVWSDAPFYQHIAPGAEVEAEVRKSPDGKYTNLVMANTSSTGGTRGGGAFKSAQIEKAMDKKAGQIAQAQDRSAWMWSKNNASTLISGMKLLEDKPMTLKDMADRVIHLATLIYNGEPNEPFTTPSREEPEVDMSGIEF